MVWRVLGAIVLAAPSRLASWTLLVMKEKAARHGGEHVIQRTIENSGDERQ